MNKVLCCVLLLFVLIKPCIAREVNSDDLLSVVRLTSVSATQEKITSLLGKPMKIEDGKKRTYWFYSRGSAHLVISWNKKSALFEKFTFTCEPVKKTVFDRKLSQKLKSGATDIVQAINILGTPKDMTIKGGKQEMHYAYQNKLLRLFFRDRVLVDFCLY